MFNKNSIFFTLGLSLLFTIVLLAISFFTINEIDKKNHFNNLKKKYSTISQIVNQEYARFGFTNDLKRMINNMDLILIEEDEDIHSILKNKDLELLIRRRSENILLHIFKSNNDNFLHFQTPFEEFIIVDENAMFSKYDKFTISIFSLLLLGILLIAYSVYKKLSPLYELKEKINCIGQKEMTLQFLQEDAKDEVSLLAKALLDKSQNINQLKTARDVFIRNIMHELKTPITKGRFLTELPESNENKEKLKKVFHQLELLISEFAVIEEVIAKKETIEKKDIFVDDIIENALDLLLIDDENSIHTTQNNVKIYVNFKLFSIVVKNMIDNALKYSNNTKVKIEVQKNTLTFINQGEKLEHPLEKYYEPFFAHNSTKKESFGLGLYIVKSILDVHNFTLKYEYKNNENRFIILL